MTCGLLAAATWLFAASAAAQAPKPLAPPPPPVPVPVGATETATATETAAAGPLTVTDVMAMYQAGLGDGVIIESIRQNGIASRLGAAELISMRRHGISNEVLQAMQQQAPLPATRLAAPAASVAPAARSYVSRPTVLEPIVQPVIVAPPVYRSYCPGYYYHHHWRHYHPVRTSSFGIHFGF